MASSTEEPRAEPQPAVDMEKAGPATTTLKDDEEEEYPPMAKLVVLVALVRLLQTLFLV